MACLLFVVLCTFNAISESSRDGVQLSSAHENVGALVASKPELVLFRSAFVEPHSLSSGYLFSWTLLDG
jgi:hypothetical protein